MTQKPQFEDKSICCSDHICWRSLLDESLRCQAREAAHYVVKQMCRPQLVQDIAQRAKEQSSFPLSWDLSSPASAAQLALFYYVVARCFPEHQWNITAHHYLKLMAANSQQHGLISPSLFGGTSGVALAIQHCSEGGRLYQQTMAHLHQSLLEQICKRRAWYPPLAAGGAEAVFDLILGAAGILGYLVNVPSPAPSVSEALHVLLNYLITLTAPEQPFGQELWLCLPTHFTKEQDRQLYPSGRFNCGLAHGVAGPLAALSLTALAGYDHPGLHESIRYVSQWLLQHQIQDEWGITWPTVVPYELASSPEQWRSLPGARTAWCYGAPGIARSLWLAGLALQEASLRNVALEAIKAVLHRPLSVRRIDAPTLCHGTAGLLLICLHFVHESQDPWLLGQIPSLVKSILVQFDPQSPLGFRDIEPGGTLVDRPDLLMGAPGTALALLAAASDIAPSWDRLLLLS